MNVIKILSIIIFSLSFCLSANAKPYFTSTAVTPKLIDPPFFEGTKQWEREIKQIVRMQKKYNLEEIDKALAEKHVRPELMLETLGDKYSKEEYPKLHHLLKRVGDTSYNIAHKAKIYWNQTRPYLADKRVDMLISPSRSNSYPSGHTTWGYLSAHVLTLLFPKERYNLENRAKEIANHRILVGMHFPRDLHGGKQLAFIIAGGLAQNEDFLDDLEDARKEIAKKIK